MRWLQLLLIVLLSSLTSCFGLFDSGTDDIVNDYEVTWIDLHAHRALYKDISEVVPAYIAAVGYDSKYLFVKQHPLAGKQDEKVLESITNYYLIERAQSGTQDKPIYGPLSEEKFNALCAKLGITEVNFSIHYLENI